MKLSYMKKICHVTSAHPPEDGRIFRRACTTSVNAGFDTFLVEPGASYVKNGINIIGLGEPRKNGRIYRMTVFARRAIEEALKVDADLYQLHDPELLPYAMKIKKAGKAVIFDSHEDYVEQIRCKQYLPKVIAVAISNMYGMYSKYVFSNIDGLTYPGTEGEASRLDGLCERTAITDNLPWLDELYNKYEDDVERESDTACYIGALSESRGITQIVKAAYRANCKLYLAGKYSSDRYKELLEAMPEYECVTYLGVLGRSDIASLLNRVNLGLCTLLNVGQYYKMNNLPTKVYEYMSMGLPVILNNSSFNVRINEEIQFGMTVDPLDIDSFSEAIRILLDNENQCKVLGENGRKAVQERFCWDKAQNKLIEMYNDILI